MQSNYKYYIKRQDNAPRIQCTCGCGEIIPNVTRRGQPMSFKSGHSQKGELNWRWKGGRIRHKNYWLLRMPNHPKSDNKGYVPEHIYFYEQYNKCSLLPWGVVHHIIPVTKDYCNNMPWNLQGMTKKHHIRLHKTLDLSHRICIKCNSPNSSTRKHNGRIKWHTNPIGDGYYCVRCYMNWYDKNKRKR